MAKCANYPILLVHGMYGCGRDEGINRYAPYWGANAGLLEASSASTRNTPPCRRSNQNALKSREFQGVFCRYRQKTKKIETRFD